MSKTAAEIMEMIQQQGIKMVDFKIVDINGQFRHVTIPASQFTEQTMVNGIGFDAYNYGPLAQYPRNIVQAAEQYMKDSGVADIMLILPEFDRYFNLYAGIIQFSTKNAPDYQMRFLVQMLEIKLILN